MSATITSILSTYSLVLNAIVDTITDIASWILTNPLLLIAVAFTVVGFGFNIVRSMIKN
jgi:hypothetical protein